MSAHAKIFECASFGVSPLARPYEPWWVNAAGGVVSNEKTLSSKTDTMAGDGQDKSSQNSRYALNRFIYGDDTRSVPTIPSFDFGTVLQPEESAGRAPPRRVNLRELDRNLEFENPLGDVSLPSRPPSVISIDLGPDLSIEQPANMPGDDSLEGEDPEDYPPEETEMELPSVLQLTIAPGVSLKATYPVLFQYGNSRVSAEEAGHVAEFDKETETKISNGHVLISELEAPLAWAQDYSSFQAIGVPEYTAQWGVEAVAFESEGKSLLALGDGTDGLV